jgi:hypothetical protein
MTSQNTEPTNLRQTARLAGVLYLVIIIAGIFAEFIIRQSLLVPGDAAQTAANIAADAGLFRVSIAADFIMILADVATGILFYVLLRPVNRTLALLAAFFRLAQSTVLGANLLNLLLVLELTGGADYLGTLGAEQTDALALFFMEAHATGYTLALIFFGVYLFLIGYLVMKAGYMPRVLGILLAVAAAGYLTDSFANILLSNYDDYADLFGIIVFAPALLAEGAMALYLLLRGVKSEQAVPAIKLHTAPAEAIGD